VRDTGAHREGANSFVCMLNTYSSTLAVVPNASGGINMLLLVRKGMVVQSTAEWVL
jgi:hypothetical protein